MITKKSIIFTSLLVVLIGCAGSSARKEQYEAKEDIKREIMYGQLLAKEILKKYPMLKNDTVNRYVNLVGKSVALFSGRSDIVYHFAVLDSDSINAFAAPGGYVFITKGALMAMKNESELAGVLAHEIGHINLKHIMKELPPPRETTGFVDRVAAVLLAQGTFVSSAFNAVVDKAAKLLFETGYKKESEYEADKVALLYANETGYYQAGLIDFLDRINNIKERSKDAVVYNTHPANDDRINRLKKLMADTNMKANLPKVAERFNKHLKPILKELYQVAIELEYGRTLAHSFIKQFKTLQDKKIFQYVNTVGKSVALFSGKTGLTFQFEILDTEKIGTLSTPGGYIFITKGALKALKTEAELAAVLAHEIALVNDKRILKRFAPPDDYFDKGFYKKLVIIASQARDMLLNRGYDSDELVIADQATVHYISETGYYPASMLDFLQRIAALSGNRLLADKQQVALRITKLTSYIKNGKFDLNKPKVQDRYLSKIGSL